MSRPNAKHVLSPADRSLLEQYGTAVVECSWARLKEVPFSRIGGKCERLRESEKTGYDLQSKSANLGQFHILWQQILSTTEGHGG